MNHLAPTPALSPFPNRRALLLGSAAGLLLSACGGGGGDPLGLPADTPANPAPPGVTSPWAAPLALTSSASLTASLLKIACNDAGDAIAAWQEVSASGTRRLLGRRYQVAVGWDPVHEIATSTGSGNLEADLAMDALGQAWVVWTAQVGSSHQTSAMRHLPLGGWQPAVRINTTNDAVLATNARVSVDALGNALVGWIASRATATPRVLVRPWGTLSGWGAESVMNTAIDTDPRELVLALGSTNQGVVGWIEPGGANPGVWAARWSLTAGPQPDPRITEAGSVNNLSIASDTNGTILMAWRQVFAAAERVRTVRFAAAGSPTRVESRDNPPPGAVGRPSIDAGGPGHFAAVWNEVLGTRSDAWRTLIDNNDSSTPSVLLETDASADAFDVQVALDTGNRGLAVWLRGAGAQAEIWTSAQSTASVWTAPERIGNNTGDASSLQLKGSEGGRALVAWLQPEAGVNRV